MRSHARRAIWPYLLILAALFMLSFMAPRGWRDDDIKPAAAPSISPSAGFEREPAFVRPAEVLAPMPDGSSPGGPIEYEPPTRPQPAAIAPKVTGQVWHDAAAELTARPAAIAPLEPEPALPDIESRAHEEVGPWDRFSTCPYRQVDSRSGQVENLSHGDAALTVSPDATQPAVAPEPPPAADPIGEKPPGEGEQAAEPRSQATELRSQTTEPRSLLLPVSLLSRLQVVGEQADCAAWARRTTQAVNALLAENGPSDAERQRLFAELSTLADEAGELANKVDPATATELRRLQYALRRRLDIWPELLRAERPTSVDVAASQQRLSARLNEVEALLGDKPQSSVWRHYLLLAELRAFCDKKSAATEAEGQTLATELLDRLASQKLGDSQRKLIHSAPVATLADELRAWRAASVDSRRLLDQLEQYETDGLASRGRQLADMRWSLACSTDAAERELAKRLETHYRNANARITIDGRLLNRLTPRPEARLADVDDTVVGVPVQGQSITSTRLFVRLIPDPMRLRLGIEANGTVNSRTAATSGPATLVSQGESTFLVRKQLFYTRQGLNMLSAKAVADSSADLESVSTSFDNVPLLNNVVRNIATSKNEEMKAQVAREVEQKVAFAACQRVDEEAGPRIAKAEADFQRRVLGPLEHLALEPTPLTLETTAEQLVMRYRLAAPEQLGANTARPRQPDGSWYGFQVHESAINNAAENLNLAGHEFTPLELQRWLAERLSRPFKPNPDDDLPDDVRLTMADDGIHVHFDGQQMEVLLSVAELSQGTKTRWTHFKVRAVYKPVVHGSQVELVRSGSIELIAKKYEGKPQVALRGIFSKVLTRERAIPLVPEKIAGDARLADLAVNHCVLEDGWLSIALDPTRATDLRSRAPAKKPVLR